MSRGLHAKGVRGKPSLKARKLMQPQNNSSPETEDTFELKNGMSQSGSVKRLLHSSENIQSAKRSRTMQVQKLPECDTSLPVTMRNKSLKTLSMFLKSPEKKISADSDSFESRRLSTGPCVKMNGKTNGFSKLSKNSTHQLSFSTSEKENSLAVNVKPEIDMGAVCGTNDLDLVMSYSSWIKNGSTEEKETVLNCPITKKRPLSTAELQVKEKIADAKTLPAPFEDDFTDLIDDWFDDGMEQKSEAPKPKKFIHEYDYFIQRIYVYISELLFVEFCVLKLKIIYFSLIFRKTKGIPEHVILASGVHNRYWVLDVQDVTSSLHCTEKHLTITCSKTTQSTETCILKDGWYKMLLDYERDS